MNHPDGSTPTQAFAAEKTFFAGKEKSPGLDGSAPVRVTDVVGTAGDTGLIIGDYFTAPGQKKMILMADHQTDGVWLAGIADYVDEDWYGTRAEFDAAGWIPATTQPE